MKKKRINDGDHYGVYAVASKIARDEDPVQQAFVHRRATLTQAQWDTFLGVEPDMGASDYSNASFSSAKGAAPVQHKSGILRKNTSTYDMEASNRNPKKSNRSDRSIFGLPIISPLTFFAKFWSSLILVLDLIYTAFLIPILVAFEVPDVGWTYGCIINLIAGTFYFAELLLNFHIGFIGKLGTQKKLIKDGKAVAWYYITQGQFVVDTLTAVAWIAQITLIILSDSGVNISGPISTLYQVIRILRMIRFISLMNRLYATAIAAGGAILPALNLKPHYAYFVNLIYGGLAILSFLSCIMNFVVRREGYTTTWINKFGVFIRMYGSPDSQTAGILTPDECAAVPDPAKWLAGAYFMLVTMLSIGYGDITPQTFAEIIVCMFCMIAGIIFFGILLGSIAEALTDLNKESKRIAKYRARMESVDKWMGKRGLAKNLRLRIGQHYQEEWIADSEAVEEVQIMEEVPHSLRREIAYAVNRKVFSKLEVFHDFPVAEQMTIASMMTPLQLPAGADICEAGDVADCIWVLHEGSVAAVDANGFETSVMVAPALLGETALLRELNEEYHFLPCALRTRQMCLLWVIPMRDLLPLLRRNPALYHKAVQQAVPAVPFDYLAINPIGNHVGGGVSSVSNGSKHSASENVSGGGGGGGGGGGSGLVNTRKTPPSSQFAAVAAAAMAAAGPMSPRDGGSSLETRPSGPRPLQTAQSGGIDRKPSWTTLQQQHLKNQRRGANAQSQGFNGLISKH